MKLSKALKGREITWTSPGPKGQKLNHGKNVSKALLEYYKNNPKIAKEKIVSPSLVKEIREKYNTGDFSKSDLSREYGVSWGTIKNIVNKLKSYLN